MKKFDKLIAMTELHQEIDRIGKIENPIMQMASYMGLADFLDKIYVQGFEDALNLDISK